jgi:HK97 family phage major capsid protein
VNEEIKKVNDELQAGITAIRDTQKTLEGKLGEKYDKAMLDKELQPVIDKVEKKIDELEVGLKRVNTVTRDVKEASPEHKSLIEQLRYGRCEKPEFLKKANPPETKVMKIGDDTTGGYLASPEMDGGILKTITEFSPVRTVAYVRTTGRESVKARTRTAQFAANWEGEAANQAETTGLTFGMETIPTHELRAYCDVTNWDLEDSDFNFEQLLNDEFGEQFGVAEGTAFITGNVTTRPEGILTNANVGTANAGNATVITADGLIGMYFTPKSGYAGNFKWLMRRTTMAAICKLKNNNADYLLKRLGDTPVWNILGSDVIECPDVPAEANAAYPVILGDFRRGYEIVDRVGITVLRDPYTQAHKSTVRFHARKRVGGKVIMAEAIYKMLVQA